MRFFTILFFTWAFISMNAQEVTVQPTLFGLQFGSNGLSAHGELKLSPTSTARVELAMALGALIDSDDIDFFVFPLIIAESRRYYNLFKRHAVGKNTDKNSANFYGLFLTYQPTKITTIRNRRIRFSQATSIYARWGLRRVYGKHFTLETAVGPGVVLYNLGFDPQTIFNINFHFGIGYTF